VYTVRARKVHEAGLKLNMMADLSLEFLMGRALDNAMLNTGMKDIASGMKSK
jgi:starch phosphorylase